MSNEDTIPDQTGPVGDGNVEVKQGESVLNLVAMRGLNWETVWNAPENKKLFDARNGDATTLLPGDRLHVPEKEMGWESAKTEQKHRFKAKSKTTVFRVAFEGPEGPRADEPYIVDAAGVKSEGTLDADGRLEVAIPLNLYELVVLLGEAPDYEKIVVELGALDPITETSGIQERLNHLGYDSGEVDGIPGPITRGAVVAFQSEHAEAPHKLAVDGIAGPKTQAALDAEYSSHTG